MSRRLAKQRLKRQFHVSRQSCAEHHFTGSSRFPAKPAKGYGEPRFALRLMNDFGKKLWRAKNFLRLDYLFYLNL